MFTIEGTLDRKEGRQEISRQNHRSKTRLTSFKLFFALFSLKMALVQNLGCKGELCYDVGLVLRVAEEGIVLTGYINTIIGLYVAPIVLDMQAVRLKGLTANAIFFTAVLALK